MLSLGLRSAAIPGRSPCLGNSERVNSLPQFHDGGVHFSRVFSHNFVSTDPR